MLRLRTPWRDTLFARLFVLLWATLVLSHAVAFGVVTQVVIPLTKPRTEAANPDHARPQVVFPSLPPADVPALQGPAPAHPGLPLPVLLLDYALRLAAMGLAAWWGARWLSRPVQRMVSAAQDMADALEQGRPPTPLDASGETIEMQQAATVFNGMANDLHRAFRSRELLFATVSHDLRTPMTRLRLRLECQPGPAELAQCIQDIAQMDDMVGSALAMVRTAPLTQSLQNVRLDALLDAVVQDCADMGVTLWWEGSAKPSTALAEPLALRRVIDNVVNNALRHATQVKLSLDDEPARASVAITVEDNGSGIAPEQLTRMREAQSHTQPAREASGHGLGLYIAQDLMRLQGGTIELANRPEGGLRVTIRLQSAS